MPLSKVTVSGRFDEGDVMVDVDPEIDDEAERMDSRLKRLYEIVEREGLGVLSYSYPGAPRFSVNDVTVFELKAERFKLVKVLQEAGFKIL